MSTDFDDQPPTVPDRLVPLTSEEERRLSEFGEHETTPVIQTVCRECAGDIVPIEDWRPPTDAATAWREWNAACVWSASQNWTFCPSTGGHWRNGVRFDFERRRPRNAMPVAWKGEERRRGG